MSIRIPKRVLISETASAPSASTAFAIATISVTLGLSLTISGLLVAPRTAFVTAAAIWGVEPKAAPPSLTLGQEMFSSIMSTAVPSSFWAMVMQSSTVEPATLARIVTSFVRKYGSSCSIKASIPGFCRPTEFSIPEGVSAIRGGGLPSFKLRVVPLQEMPPSLERG